MHRYRESNKDQIIRAASSSTRLSNRLKLFKSKKRKIRVPRTIVRKTRFMILNSVEILQKKSSNHEIRKKFKRKIRNSMSYRNGTKSTMRIVDKKFGKGFSFRAFFYFPYGRTGIAYQSQEIKSALASLTGKFKVVRPNDHPDHYDSVFLEDESDLHILVLILGRSKITKIFKFE